MIEQFDNRRMETLFWRTAPIDPDRFRDLCVELEVGNGDDLDIFEIMVGAFEDEAMSATLRYPTSR